MQARGADADEAAALALAIADVWDQHVSVTKETRGEKGVVLPGTEFEPGSPDPEQRDVATRVVFGW